MAELAFRFHASDGRRGRTSGVILASDVDQAIFRLRAVGLTEASASFDPIASVRGMLSPGFEQHDLALFYRTLADRLDSEVPAIEAISSSAEFVRDPRLRHAVRIAALTARAAPLHSALTTAGFPTVDCSLLEAVSASARTSETLKTMADRIDREIKLKTSIVKTLLPSLAALSVLAIGFWAFVTYLAPEYYRFFSDRGLLEKMTPWVRTVYDVSVSLERQKVIFTTVYLGSVAVLAFAAIAGKLGPLLNLMPGVAPLFERWEHLRLWSAFRVMARADIPFQRVFRMLSAAASMPSTRDAFARAARLAESGTALGDLVVLVQLPDYVSRFIKASAPGRLDQAVQRLLASMEFDAETLAQRVQWISTFIGFGSIVLAILFAYRVSYIEVFLLLRQMVS